MSKLGFTITMWWCEDCLPDGLGGIDPMSPFEAQGELCDSCGADLHGVPAPIPNQAEHLEGAA